MEELSLPCPVYNIGGTPNGRLLGVHCGWGRMRWGSGLCRCLRPLEWKMKAIRRCIMLTELMRRGRSDAQHQE